METNFSNSNLMIKIKDYQLNNYILSNKKLAFIF